MSGRIDGSAGAAEELALVFAHGAGRAGPGAFPLQAAAFPRADFPVLAGYGDAEPAPGDLEASARLLAARAGDADGIVGWSYGGVAAAMAASLAPISSLVLLEPALYQLARDRPACAAAIARVDPVYRDASLTDASFERTLMLALTGDDIGAARSRDELRSSRRARVHGAPWRHPVDPAALAQTRMLVLTGGWSAEYEEVAAALVELGAEHEVLAGHGHDVPQHPDCSERIRAFVAGG